MKKLLLILLCLPIIGFGQEISKKERKKTKKALIERIKDFSQAKEDDFKGKYSNLEFIKKSYEFNDVISIINLYDLSSKFYLSSVCKKKKQVIAFLTNGYIKENSHNLLNIYEFQEEETQQNILLLEFQSKDNNDKFSYNVIVKNSFIKIANNFRNGNNKIKALTNEKFKILLVIDKVNKFYYSEKNNQKYEIIDSEESKFKLIVFSEIYSINDIAYSQEIHNSIAYDINFIVEKANHNTFTLGDNISITTGLSTNYGDNISLMKSLPNEQRNFLNGKTFPIADLDKDNFYYKINFSLDSIKLYRLNEEKFYSYIFSQEQTKDYLTKKEKNSIKERSKKQILFNNHLNEFSYEELKMMTKKDYWEKFLPDNEEFTLKFLDEEYITPKFQILASDSDFLVDDKITFAATLINSSLNDMFDDLDYSSTTFRSFKHYHFSSKVIRDLCIDLLSTKSIKANDDSHLSAKKERIQKELISAFGKKYVDEAQKGNIIIGMPEALLHIPLRVWNIESNSEWKNGFRIYCTYKFDTSRKLLISVYDGKVSSISNW